MSIEAMKQALEALEDIFGKNKVDVGAINALRQAIAEAEKQEHVAWFDNAGTIRGRVSDEQIDLLCRSAITEISKRNGWSEEGPSRADYERLQALVTSQGIRLMEYESTIPHPQPAQPKAEQAWVGLTKKEVHDLYDSDYVVFHQRIEAKLKAKNSL